MALKRLLDGAFQESLHVRGSMTVGVVDQAKFRRDAANEPSYRQQVASSWGIFYRLCDKNGANLVRIAPFLLAFLHFFVPDPIQCLAAWLLASWPFLVDAWKGSK